MMRHVGFLRHAAVHAQDDAAVMSLHPLPLAQALAHILEPNSALLYARGAIVLGRACRRADVVVARLCHEYLVRLGVRLRARVRVRLRVRVRVRVRVGVRVRVRVRVRLGVRVRVRVGVGVGLRQVTSGEQVAKGIDGGDDQWPKRPSHH